MHRRHRAELYSAGMARRRIVRSRSAVGWLLMAILVVGIAGCGGGDDDGGGGDGARSGDAVDEQGAPPGVAEARRAAAPAQACLTRAGYRVTAGSPRLDDKNAPDYQLVIQRRRAGDGAFIAFYADPARADRYAAAIGRRRRRFGRASVERRGSVTIVWVRLPQERRERVRDCLRA